MTTETSGVVALLMGTRSTAASYRDLRFRSDVAAQQHVAHGAQEQLEVEPERPVGDVEVVDADHLAHRHPAAQHLPRPGHPGREVQAAAVEAEHLRVLV